LSTSADRQIVFVCQHGAFRSRLAAAYFNEAAPVGWHAISAGVTPQSQVSERVAPLLQGTDASRYVDSDPPRGLDAVSGSVTIAIDVELPGAETWMTTTDDAGLSDPELRDVIRGRVQDFVRQLGGPPAERNSLPSGQRQDEQARS
jgi:hypothetical protein